MLSPLLPADSAAAAAAVSGAADEGGHHHHKHSFTHYVRRVEVVLDPAQYPGDSGRFVWEKSQHEREHREALHVRRLGSAPVDARVTVQLDHQPAQWRLSGALAAALGLRGLHSSPFVMQMLWGYIKAKQLYEVGGWAGWWVVWVGVWRCVPAALLLLGSVGGPVGSTASPAPLATERRHCQQSACPSCRRLPPCCRRLLSCFPAQRPRRCARALRRQAA